MSLLVKVVPLSGSETLWVYSRLDDLPLWTRYDSRTQQQTVRGNYELLVSPTQDGTYYFSIYGRNVSETGGYYRIVVNVIERYLSDVSPHSAGNAGQITLSLSGLGFTENVRAELRRTGLPTFAADNIILASPTTLWAHFDLTGAATGVYDVRVSWLTGGEASLASAFTITQGIGPRLEAHLVAPEAVRPGRQYVLQVEYANTGDADMPTPLLRISAENADLRLPEQDDFVGSSIQLFATSTGGPTGILLPGVGGRISLIFRPGGSGGVAGFSVSKLEANKLISVDSAIPVTVQQALASDSQISTGSYEVDETRFPPTSSTVPDAPILIDNSVFAAIERFYTPHIQSCFEEQGSGLAIYQVDVLGEPQSAAEIIMNASIGYDYMVSPKILLAMLESISGLVTDPSPSQDKLDFAMGNFSSTLRGFEKQVNWAASEIGRAYERYYYEMPEDQRYLAASFALQAFSKSLSDEGLSRRLLDVTSHQSIPQSYQRLFGNSPQIAPQDIGDISIELLSFMQRPFDTSPTDYPGINAFFDHEPGIASATIFMGSAAAVPFDTHHGFDYGLGWDEAVRAAATGNIAHAGTATNETHCYDGPVNPNGPTKYIAVDHDLDNDDDPDFRTLYWHLNSNTRPDGTDWEDDDPVDAHDQIGQAGNTGRVDGCPSYKGDPAGTHLHFEVKGDPAIFAPGGSVYTGQSMDPFGWWSSTRDDPIGTPYSRWLWESSDEVDDLDASFEKFGTGREFGTYGEQGHAWLASRTDQWGVWGLKAPEVGDYYVEIFVPHIQERSYRDGKYDLLTPSHISPGRAVRFLDNYAIDQERNRSQWVRLGGSDISPIGLQKGEIVLVRLSTPSGPDGTYTAFDAVRLVKARPAGPTNLIASATGQESIHLEWTDNAVNEAGFRIFRDGNGTPIATVGPNDTSYNNVGLHCSTTYRYYVTAFNNAGDSDPSNTAVATTASCPPPDPIKVLLDEIVSLIIRPVDPNDKVGPLGSGDMRIVSPDSVLQYTIDFENLATATAPVQELVIEDSLDPNLDWTTLQFNDVAYGDRILVMPGNVYEFSGRDFPTSTSITGTTQGPMAIDVTVSLSPETGRLEWRLGAVDTATGLLPADPLAGFLPPEDGTGRGQGHVSFLIEPKVGVTLGAHITNTASIVFDTNDPIETNEAWNTIGTPGYRAFLPLVLRNR